MLRETTEETAGKADERRMCPTGFEWNGGQIGNGICKDPGNRTVGRMQAAAALQKQKQDPGYPAERGYPGPALFGEVREREAPDGTGPTHHKMEICQLSTMAFTASMRSTT